MHANGNGARPIGHVLVEVMPVGVVVKSQCPNHAETAWILTQALFQVQQAAIQEDRNERAKRVTAATEADVPPVPKLVEA